MKETRNGAKTEEYKIGLDLSFIDYNSQGGQAYFCYNLLKGLYEIQCDSNDCRHFKLTVFCTKNVSEKVMQVCPSAKIVYTKEFGYSVEKLISFYVSRTMYRDMVLPQIIKKEAPDGAVQ